MSSQSHVSKVVAAEMQQMTNKLGDSTLPKGWFDSENSKRVFWIDIYIWKALSADSRLVAVWRPSFVNRFVYS